MWQSVISKYTVFTWLNTAAFITQVPWQFEFTYYSFLINNVYILVFFQNIQGAMFHQANTAGRQVPGIEIHQDLHCTCRIIFIAFLKLPHP